MSNSQDYIRNRMAWLNERATQRTKTIDPATGQLGFAHPAEVRRKSQSELKQLEQSLAFQIQQDERMAGERVAQRNANEQEERDRYNQNQAIRQRAQAIRVEKEAQQLAGSSATLTGPASEVSVVHSA